MKIRKGYFGERWQALRENPDLWGVSVIVVALMLFSSGAFQPLMAQRGLAGRTAVNALPLASTMLISMREQCPDTTGRMLRAAAPKDPESLGRWVSKFEARREKFWQRLDDQMTRLQRRFNQHEAKLRSRCITLEN